MTKDLVRLLRICSVFGICLQNPKCFGFKGEFLFTIYIILLMAKVLIFCIMGISQNEVINEYIISWMVSTTVYISQMFTHFIIMCEALTKHEKHKEFLRILYRIDATFIIRLKMNIKKSRIIEELRCRFLCLTFVSTLGLVIFAINVVINKAAGYFWWALIAILAMRLRFLQLIVYVDILKYYLLGLNKKLNQVVCLKTEGSKQLLDINYKHLQSIETIKSIKDIYASIYKASMLMNEFGQASMFAASVSTFLDLTCHIYWILLALENLFSSYNITSSVATIIPLGWFLFKFCHTCEIIKQETNRTSLLVSRLSTISPSCLNLNKTYKKFIHDFSMQIMHQRIEFTGKRFFTFDYHFIFGICALIATHLIILIQFTKSDASHA